ncbi:Yip1 family protein [Paraglaciecola arctica]|uniref:Yip1 family protein n=1 Tax=Paraglaciecola arctica TaxID=1128911 RepID=UPI001C07D7F6|nr:Yip1 family protein [Paraglaciecola arctica]MBU3003735.1 YIP1 family protein [Paraglaciecola arctica]
MQQVSNPFQAMKDIITKPNRVFATINEVDNWSWIPFLFIAATGAIPIYLYFNFVDFAWYNELMVQSVAGDLSPAEQSAVRNAMADQAQSLWAGVFGSVLVVIISNAILALYFNIMTRSDEECVQGYTDWYGFAWWISLPSVVCSLISILVVVLAQDNQLSPVSLAPTSLAFIFSIETSSQWSSLLQSIRLESIWVMYLTAVGLSQWTKFSANRNYTIAVAPYLTIWIIWTLIIIF